MRRITKYKYKKKILIFLIIIIIQIPISILVYNNYNKNKDIYKDTNLLLGTWIYNEYNGTYVFNKDYTYIQYSNEDTTNNYCQGTYKYTYGATSNDGVKLRQDDNYYYYDLTLTETKCLITNKLITEKYTKKMYFGIYKNNSKKDEIIFANAETENIFTLTKVKN